MEVGRNDGAVVHCIWKCSKEPDSPFVSSLYKLTLCSTSLSPQALGPVELTIAMVCKWKFKMQGEDYEKQTCWASHDLSRGCDVNLLDWVGFPGNSQAKMLLFSNNLRTGYWSIFVRTVLTANGSERFSVPSPSLPPQTPPGLLQTKYCISSLFCIAHHEETIPRSFLQFHASSSPAI